MKKYKNKIYFKLIPMEPTETPIKVEAYEVYRLSTISRTPVKNVEPVKINPHSVTVDEFYELAEYLCSIGDLNLITKIFMENKHMSITEHMISIARNKLHLNVVIWLLNFEKSQKDGLFKEQYKTVISKPYKPYEPPINHKKYNNFVSNK
jgi:hypothetical protein